MRVDDDSATLFLLLLLLRNNGDDELRKRVERRTVHVMMSLLENIILCISLRYLVYKYLVELPSAYCIIHANGLSKCQ